MVLANFYMHIKNCGSDYSIFCVKMCVYILLRVHMFMVERISTIKHTKDQKKRMLAACYKIKREKKMISIE